MKIGLFDSGLGGILILKAVVKHLPQYDYEYYGDTKHVPYGDKTEAQVYQLTKQGIEHLFSRDCSLIIIACNTASAETLRRLQDEFLPVTYPERRILGVIIPVVENVITQACKNVLLVATARTVSSGKYHIELHKRDQSITLLSIATPTLVPLIEESNLSEAAEHLQEILLNARHTHGQSDGIILGCTHYSVLLPFLNFDAVGEVAVFDQTKIIPESLCAYLDHHPEIRNTLSSSGYRNIFLTEHRKNYDTHLASFLKGSY